MHDDRSTGADRASATKASSRQPRADAARRTYLLSAALTAFAALGLVRLDLDAFPSVGWAMPVWAVAALAVAGALMVFDVEFRSETYTFTFAELVLVLGLFFATPASLIVGRLGGELLFLTIRERQPLRKLSMNLSAFFAETVVLFTVQQALMPEMDAREPRSWLVALVAVVAAELVGFSAVATAVRWHGGPLTFRSILQIGLVTAPANTSLALVICVLLDAEPLAVPLLGGVAVFLLVTYRSYSALRQRYESLSLLYDFTHLVSGAREPDEVLDAMLNQAKDLLRAERAEFWLQRGDDVYQRHVVDDEGHSSSRLSIPAGLAQLVADGLADRHDAVLLARGEPTRPSSALGDLGARDALVAPILEGDLLIGFVVVANRLSDIYTFVNQDARIFGTLASHAGVALQNGRLIQRLHEQARQREHEALHDPLTGLPNRAQFADRLERRFDDLGHREIAIALMDLDGFKEINDTLGHQSGDRVLVEVAARLQEVVDDDTLAVRLGGDEFALLAPPRATRAGLEATCGAIRRAIGAPIDIDGIHVTMGVSIGLALAPHDGATAETLIRCADVAMYAAKSGSGSGVCFYDADYDENTPRRLTLAHELRTALEARQLHAVFQPKIALATGRVTGVEALCRWEHPTLGTVMPDEFIPLADRIGASGELTALMLSTSIEQVERWEAAGQRLDVAVNVSMQALVDPGLVETVRRLLADSTIEPRRLTLEITETNVMSDAERTLGVLGELAAVGVRLSIDDFGTGYSSLAYLQRLPVDEVKIDKGFVQTLGVDRGADAIVRSVLDLARHLHLWVVAEGVEDSRAAERLSELGCPEAQGYHFARPMPADDLERFADEASSLVVTG